VAVVAGSVAHLVKRFVTSLVPGGPAVADEAWVAAVLSEAELALWRRMSGADRRHAVGVARRVGRPEWLAAALLHDVGKIESGLGTWSRAFATAARGAVGVERLPARWRAYARHPSMGAELLELAGSAPLTVAWAREHHLPPSRWTVPPDAAAALKAADDD